METFNVDGIDDEEDYTIQIIDTIGFEDTSCKYTDKQIGEMIMQEVMGQAEEHISPNDRRGSVFLNAQVPNKIDAILIVDRATGSYVSHEQTYQKLAKIFLTAEMKDSMMVMITDVKGTDEESVNDRITHAKNLKYAGVVPWESNKLKFSPEEHRNQLKDFFCQLKKVKPFTNE